MNPLPKVVSVVTLVVSLAAGLGTLLGVPFIQAFVTGFLAAHPTWAAVIGAVTVLLTALSHSLPGDGGDGSKPVN